MLQYALRPPAVIIVQKDMTLSYPSHVPSTRFPTGTVLALLAAFGKKTTTLSCHTTSHRAGHTIRRLTRNVLVEMIGIEPIVTEVGGVTVPCHTIAAASPCVVLDSGVEPLLPG